MRNQQVIDPYATFINSHSSTSAAAAPPPPPLILIGGTAQTMDSWKGHQHILSREGRTVVCYEARGQGNMTSLSLKNCTLAQHAKDLELLLKALNIPSNNHQQVDLCGVSFGARVAMAFAATRPSLVRKIVLSGVAGDRGPRGRLVVEGWKKLLIAGNYQGFMWLTMTNSHSQAFIEQHFERIPEWINLAMRRNTLDGLRENVVQSHPEKDDDPFSTFSLARQITCPTLLIGGNEDLIVPASSVLAFASQFQKNHCTAHILASCGHACPIDQPKKWRDLVLSFLNN